MSVSSERSSDASSTTSPICIEIKIMDELMTKGGPSKVETTIAELLSKYDCFSDRRAGGGKSYASGHRCPGGGRADARPNAKEREREREKEREREPRASEWRSGESVSSWNAAVKESKRPRIGNDTDPGTRAIRSLLNKINNSNFDVIQSKVVELVLSGGVSVCVAVDALLDKSSTDGDGFTMAYTRLLSAIAATESAPVRTATLKRIGEFLHEIYGSGDVLWNEVNSVSEATVRFKPTEDYDGFCAALKAKKKIYGRHKTALMILTLMAKDISGIPKPADAASKLMGLMKRAVQLSPSAGAFAPSHSRHSRHSTQFHCLELELEAETEESPVVDRSAVRDVAFEILLELVSQLSLTLAAVKKEAFVGALRSLKTGLHETLTEEVTTSCGTQCRFRTEAVIAKLDEEVRSASVALVRKDNQTVCAPARSHDPPQRIRQSHSSHSSETARKAAGVAMREGGGAFRGGRNPERVGQNTTFVRAPIRVDGPSLEPKNPKDQSLSWRAVVAKP